MAIFLSRIKRALNVGSKSITNNGTYYASADGYDGYDEVTVNVSGGSATPITPSNANPVALSSGVAVEPTANGYAIQSYDNITPPSSPQAISSGDILKMIGNGYVIDTYSTATPSDSTPPQLSQGNVYVPNGNGYLYATQQGGSTETVLWTNNSPTSSFAVQTVTISDDYTNYDYLEFYFRSTTSDDTEYRDIIPTSVLAKSTSASTCTIGNSSSSKIRSRGIYATSNTSIRISDCYPLNSTSASNTSVIPTKIVGISVALPPSVGNVKVGYVQLSTSASTTVNLGWHPKYISLLITKTNGVGATTVYNEDALGTSYVAVAGDGSSLSRASLPNSNNYRIGSVSDTGFTINKVTSGYTDAYYFALG